MAGRRDVLRRVADRLDTSAPLRWLLFGLASAVTVVIVGYHVGTFDQASHLPFLKKWSDPTLYPGDAFLDLRFGHTSYFWFLFEPFVGGGLEEAMFVVHLAVTWLTFCMIWSLCRLLFGSPSTSLVTVVVLALPHMGFSGFPLFEFSLLNRTFVLPFLLGALVLYLRGRWLGTAALLGLLYNLHVVSVNFVLAMIALDAFIRRREIGARMLAASGALFIVTALPVLAWRLGGAGVQLAPDPEWFGTIANGALYHLFFIFGPHLHVIAGTASGVASLGMFVVGARLCPPSRFHPSISRFVWGVLATLTVGLLAAYVVPITIVIEMQVVRAGVFLLLFAYLYFVRALVDQWERGLISPGEAAVLAGSMLSLTPAVPLLVFGILRVGLPVRARLALACTALAASMVATLAFVNHYDLWFPGVHVRARETAWQATQAWARSRTPPDTVFITPPHRWWLYESDWRVYAERSTVVTLSELLEAAFAPSYIPHWKARFDAVAPGARLRFRGDFFENLKLTADAFYGLSDADLVDIARRYHARFLVVERPHRRPWTPVFENREFIVYALPPS